MFENKRFELNDIVLSLEDFRQYILKQRNASWIIMTGWKVFGLGYVMIFLAMFFVGERDANFTPTWDIVLVMTIFKNIVMIFILVILPVAIYPIMLRRIIKNNYYKNKIDKISNSYEFYDDGIRITSKNGESRYNWNELFGVVKTQEILKIHITKQQAFVIPQKYIEGKAELVRFVEQSFSEMKTSVGVIT